MSVVKFIFFFSSSFFYPQGSKGDKGERGLTTTLNGDQFPTGIIEGPPGPPGPPGEFNYFLISLLGNDGAPDKLRQKITVFSFFFFFLQN